ncbi:MAG: hypothetical protein MRJ65_05890 [Candidatus Brocadiaceae bacterium]|nr:hypothetical protein [Candidatus Brocadiaceae bacterium]
MRWLLYLLPIYIFIVQNFVPSVYSEDTSSTGYHNTQPVTTVKGTKETREISMSKGEFTQIMDQLQGMKSLIETMKQDYDIRLNEMQEKIVSLEKEKELLAVKVHQQTSALQEEKTPKAVSIEKETLDEVTKQFAELEDQVKDIETNYGSQLEEMQVKIASTQSTASLTKDTRSPTAPLTLWSSGKNYMNISFDGLFSVGASTDDDVDSLFGGGHDPNQRGFTLQQLETTFEGSVDPYFQGQANILFQIDNEGESFLEVEEAFLTTMSLPLNLQVKAGTFFTEFGRLNETHPHTWDFVDMPLVNNRFLGTDGLRNPGARLSWLAPTENYTELFIAIQDSQGETAHSFRSEEDMFGREAVETDVHNVRDMLYTPRIKTAFELTDEQTLLLGSSASFGPNSTGSDNDTIVYGTDIFWKWKPVNAEAGFPFITWQTEVMGRRFEAGEDEESGLSRDVFHNWGAYSQVNWGFKKRWVAGLRADYVDGLEEVFVEEHEEEHEEEEEEGHHHGGEGSGFERLRLSPNITFYPTEFSKIRLQYNYDNILGDDRTEHSVFVQFEFLLGSHGAHKF